MQEKNVVTVIDYGAGNTGSVVNMIKKVGGTPALARTPTEVAEAGKLILPGVGSFDNAMRRLSELDLIAPIKHHAASGAPLLGICLGMQLLADSSEEGLLPGLGMIAGTVRHFNFDRHNADLKIPHMGWNRISRAAEHPLTRGLEDGVRFYFVHSYYFDPQDPAEILLEARYGIDFAAGVHRDNVMGVQFHPEKSHRFGMQLLKNYIEL
ncbi:imidazole glycerol phosphate synthase subunit HisH [Devosia beringensis]|uniref:imidazole glycerol phosphate synthase subunit HisH n=1 Tax=Devosia beringensis TaxID=2657486 RepID=UPI00186B5FA2|nr:imidazole glycerol phosphate synthase subunit HisH [Devosia beringensis]